jgi:hypothetical protein
MVRGNTAEHLSKARTGLKRYEQFKYKMYNTGKVCAIPSSLQKGADIEPEMR